MSERASKGTNEWDGEFGTCSFSFGIKITWFCKLCRQYYNFLLLCWCVFFSSGSCVPFFHYYNIAFAPDIAPIRFYIGASWNGNNCIPTIYSFFSRLNVSSSSTTARNTNKMCMNFMVCKIVRYITFTVDAVRKWLKHFNELIVRVLWMDKVHFHLNCKLLVFVTIINYCIGLCFSGRCCRLFVCSIAFCQHWFLSIRFLSPPSISQYHSVEHRTQDLFRSVCRFVSNFDSFQMEMEKKQCKY